LIPPGDELRFTYGLDSIETKGGLLIVYESLAGVVSATHATIENRRIRVPYHRDVIEWARHLTAPLTFSALDS